MSIRGLRMGEIFFYWLTKGLYSLRTSSWNDSGDTLDLNGKRLDIPWPAHNKTLLDPSENSECRQSTNFQLHINNRSPELGYGASNLYGEELVASGCVRAASATVSNTTSLETIASGNCEEVCIAPYDQKSSSLSLCSGPVSHEGSENHCPCITCLKIGREVSGNQDHKCRFPGCHSILSLGTTFRHERDHYGQYGKYTCLEHDCQVSTRFWYELKRHYKKHCTSPDKEIFSCPVSWCKYSGNNGFLRKDKLKSHYKNIHEGKPGPLKAGRVIKPATLKPRVSSVGNDPSKQNE
ncbi:hypothetical protein BDR22DRAFT_306267 [Usnea florida]